MEEKVVCCVGLGGVGMQFASSVVQTSAELVRQSVKIRDWASIRNKIFKIGQESQCP